MDERLKPIAEFLPDYVCGLIWSLAGLAIASTTMTYQQAGSFIIHVAKMVEPIKFADVVTGLLVTTGGVLLPYVFGLLLNPVATGVGNTLLRKWYAGWRFVLISEEQLSLATQRAKAAYGPLPVSNFPYMLMLALTAKESQNIAELQQRRERLYVQIRVALPASILVGTLLYLALGQRMLGVAIGLLIGGVVMFSSIRVASLLLRDWEERVVLAYLIETSEDVSQSKKTQTLSA